MKERFMLRKGKMYLLLREEREEIYCYDQYLEDTACSWVEGMMTRSAVLK